MTLEQGPAQTVANLANSMMATVAKLSAACDKHDFADTAEKMRYCAFTVRPLMDEVRGYADALEGEIADSCWPLPTYQEMLFIK